MTLQAAAAGLEREIRAIGGKIDSLAATAIRPETFERIRRQTEEVRNLLASAALRTPPLERLERQIGELADRVERLGASPAPQFESAEMAALLAEACRQIERSTPPAALVSIERRLEQIAARLDQEIARPSAPVGDRSRPVRRIGAPHRRASASRSRRARPQRSTPARSKGCCAISTPSSPPPAGADADAQALQSIFVEIRDKLDRLADPARSARGSWSRFSTSLARDSTRSRLRLISIRSRRCCARSRRSSRRSAAAPVDPEVVEHVADEVARRLRDVSARQVELEAVAQQIDTIYDRIDALAAKAARADDPEPVMRELLEKLREADKARGSPRRDLGRDPRRARRASGRAQSRTGERGPAHAIAAHGSAEHPGDAGCAPREHRERACGR